MQDLDRASALFLLLGTVAAFVVIYHSLRIAREWLGQWKRTITGMVRRAVVPNSSLDAHISTQWTAGRLRLDFLLALMKTLETASEQDVEMLHRLDHADLLYEREARQMAEPTLRRFIFDQHLRDECRVLVPLLQFCAQDLAKSQGLDMTQQLSALAAIQTALTSVNHG